jgi:hypothetical protein
MDDLVDIDREYILDSGIPHPAVGAACAVESPPAHEVAPIGLTG